MAAARNPDISAADDMTSYPITSLPFDVQRTDRFLPKSTVEQDSWPSGCSAVDCGYTGNSEWAVESDNSDLSFNRLGLDTVSYSSCNDASSMTQPCCWNSMSMVDVTPCSRSILCSESTSLLTDNISYPVSSASDAEKGFYQTTNGIFT